DKEGKHSAINSAPGREPLDYFVELAVKQQVSPKPDDIKQQDATTRFLNGNLAMLTQASWQIADLNTKAKAFKWDLVPVPQAPSTHKNGSTNQMASIAMAKGGKQQDAVWEWAKFTGAKEGQDI